MNAVEFSPPGPNILTGEEITEFNAFMTDMTYFAGMQEAFSEDATVQHVQQFHEQRAAMVSALDTPELQSQTQKMLNYLVFECSRLGEYDDQLAPDVRARLVISDRGRVFLYDHLDEIANIPLMPDRSPDDFQLVLARMLATLPRLGEWRTKEHIPTFISLCDRLAQSGKYYGYADLLHYSSLEEQEVIASRLNGFAEAGADLNDEYSSLQLAAMHWRPEIPLHDDVLKLIGETQGRGSTAYLRAKLAKDAGMSQMEIGRPIDTVPNLGGYL